MLKKSLPGLFQRAAARSEFAPCSENQTLNVFDFRAAHPCGAQQAVFQQPAKAELLDMRPGIFILRAHASFHDSKAGIVVSCPGGIIRA
ncbi:MAG TPA: hypothetical protein VF268_03230 [Gammaproteobacteria bacterium]|jgi:hypothetical protein